MKLKTTKVTKEIKIDTSDGLYVLCLYCGKNQRSDGIHQFLNEECTTERGKKVLKVEIYLSHYLTSVIVPPLFKRYP